MTTRPPAAVAVVNNPSQLLFATEAAFYRGVEPEQLEVVTVPTPKADEEPIYQALIGRAGYSRVRRLPISSLTRAGRLVWGADFMARYRHSLVVTSMVNFFPARCLLRHSGLRGRALVTDDGSWTVQFAEARAAVSAGAPPSIGNAMRLRDPLTFFTLFEDAHGAPGDVFVPNLLSWTRQAFGRPKSGSVDVFLGSPLVELGFLSEPTYELGVAALQRQLGGAAEYWPHRREDPSRVSALCSRLGLEQRRRTLPAEAEVLDSSAQIRAIATFPTTATRSLRRLGDLMELKVATVIPDERHVGASHRSAFRVMSRTSRLDSDIVVDLA